MGRACMIQLHAYRSPLETNREKTIAARSAVPTSSQPHGLPENNSNEPRITADHGRAQVVVVHGWCDRPPHPSAVSANALTHFSRRRGAAIGLLEGFWAAPLATTRSARIGPLMVCKGAGATPPLLSEGEGRGDGQGQGKGVVGRLGHVEPRAAACHPDLQWTHVLKRAGQKPITHVKNQICWPGFRLPCQPDGEGGRHHHLVMRTPCRTETVDHGFPVKPLGTQLASMSASGPALARKPAASLRQ